MRILNRIRRYFNPTFAEWIEDFNRGLTKELENPQVQEKLRKIITQTVNQEVMEVENEVDK